MLRPKKGGSCFSTLLSSVADPNDFFRIRIRLNGPDPVPDPCKKETIYLKKLIIALKSIFFNILFFSHYKL